MICLVGGRVARGSDFFAKNPNLKTFFFWGGGRGGGDRGVGG